MVELQILKGESIPRIITKLPTITIPVTFPATIEPVGIVEPLPRVEEVKISPEELARIKELEEALEREREREEIPAPIRPTEVTERIGGRVVLEQIPTEEEEAVTREFDPISRTVTERKGGIVTSVRVIPVTEAERREEEIEEELRKAGVEIPREIRATETLEKLTRRTLTPEIPETAPEAFREFGKGVVTTTAEFPEALRRGAVVFVTKPEIVPTLLFKTVTDIPKAAVEQPFFLVGGLVAGAAVGRVLGTAVPKPKVSTTVALGEVAQRGKLGISRAVAITKRGRAKAGAVTKSVFTIPKGEEPSFAITAGIITQPKKPPVKIAAVSAVKGVSKVRDIDISAGIARQIEIPTKPKPLDTAAIIFSKQRADLTISKGLTVGEKIIDRSLSLFRKRPPEIRPIVEPVIFPKVARQITEKPTSPELIASQQAQVISKFIEKALPKEQRPSKVITIFQRPMEVEVSEPELIVTPETIERQQVILEAPPLEVAPLIQEIEEVGKIEELAQIPKTQTGIKDIRKQREVLGKTTTQGEKEAQMFIERQAVKQAQKTKELQKQITQKITPRPRPRITPKPIPKQITPVVPLIAAKPRIKTKVPTAKTISEGFAVEVRKAGKFIRIRAKPLTRRQALKLGVAIVRETPRASFRLRRLGVPVVSRQKGLSEAEILRGQFRRPVKRSKLPVDTFIEKTPFRIDRPAELIGITKKGLETVRQNKELKKFLRGKKSKKTKVIKV